MVIIIVIMHIMVLMVFNLLEGKSNAQFLSWPRVKVEDNVILVFFPPEKSESEST